MTLYSSEVATDVAMEAVQSLMIYAGSNEIQVTHIACDPLNR